MAEIAKAGAFRFYSSKHEVNDSIVNSETLSISLSGINDLINYCLGSKKK